MGKGSKSRIGDLFAYGQNFNEIDWSKHSSVITEIKYLKRGKIRYVYGQKDLTSNIPIPPSIETPAEK